MAFAVVRQKIDVRTIPESWIFLQDIPSIAFGRQYDDRDGTARMFSPDRPAVLIENDGVIVTGNGLLQTFDRLEVAEFSARSLIMSRSLGAMVPISQDQVDELRKTCL
jgi:L-fuculose-phosphate aldolase